MSEEFVEDTAETAVAEHTHVVNNGKRELTLEELARMQPGLDRLMAEVAPRMHRLYYAGKAGNWRLAEYFYKSVIKQLALCAFSRPKYETPIKSFLAEDCEPVKTAIRRHDLVAFEAAYAHMVARANHYHDEWGKPYIHWVCPADPPADLDLTAGLG